MSVERQNVIATLFLPFGHPLHSEETGSKQRPLPQDFWNKNETNVTFIEP